MPSLDSSVSSESSSDPSSDESSSDDSSSEDSSARCLGADPCDVEGLIVPLAGDIAVV